MPSAKVAVTFATGERSDRDLKIAGELGDDGMVPMLYPTLSYMTDAMAGFEPATFGLRSNPRLHHRRNS
jgi:hypothetical protein